MNANYNEGLKGAIIMRTKRCWTIDKIHQNEKNICVLPFETMVIITSCLYDHMNVKEFKPRKTHDKKFSIINHNKNTILISLNLWSTFFFFFFGMHFQWIITKLLHAFTFFLSYVLHIQLSHNIFLIARNHINLYKFMSFGTEKKGWEK
jgi:hypothetical protein